MSGIVERDDHGDLVPDAPAEEPDARDDLSEILQGAAALDSDESDGDSEDESDGDSEDEISDYEGDSEATSGHGSEWLPQDEDEDEDEDD